MSRLVKQDNQIRQAAALEERVRALEMAESSDEITISDSTYIHVQGISSDLWSINHGMNKYPSVTVVDSAGTVIRTRVKYLDANNLEVGWAGATTGRAYLN